MGVEMDVVYQGDLHCEATHGPSGNRVVTDAPVDNGGKGSAFSPTDLVGAALGGCMLTIMGKVAERHQIKLSGARIHVVKDMASAPVRRIQKLTAIVTLPKGLALNTQQRALLESAALTCPVKQSLHPEIVFDVKFEYPA